MSNHPKVLITDETLRDGLQIEREGVTIEEKLEILNLMVKAGLNRIVVGAFVNPKWSPQMADSLELVKRLKETPGVSYFVLALNACNTFTCMPHIYSKKHQQDPRGARNAMASSH